MYPSMSRLLLLLVVGVTLVTGQSCAPNCTDVDPGTDVPDPKNCYNFYTCMVDGTPSDVSFPCPDGEKFNINSTTAQCQPNNGSVEIQCFFCEPSCIFSCPDDEVTFIGDPTDCSKYYLCGMGGDEAMPLVCEPPNSFFDGKVCQEDSSLCCDGCSVFCTEKFVEVADPANCTNFYFCTDTNYYPDKNDLFHCPSGETFNSTADHCQAGAPCVQPCD